ncbi:hypothetical protein CRG98_024210 [Punica granatum]|uniref:Uncharacterized protein n=1 Tax=Punica granatum TaxID=22663 RepID=A0A2I0JGK6_PUNGR|nr:hypothetical protein CRG98_024210 [Punica granatum]
MAVHIRSFSSTKPILDSAANLRPIFSRRKPEDEISLEATEEVAQLLRKLNDEKRLCSAYTKLVLQGMIKPPTLPRPAWGYEALQTLQPHHIEKKIPKWTPRSSTCTYKNSALEKQPEVEMDPRSSSSKGNDN